MSKDDRLVDHYFFILRLIFDNLNSDAFAKILCNVYEDKVSRPCFITLSGMHLYMVEDKLEYFGYN